MMKRRMMRRRMRGCRCRFGNLSPNLAHVKTSEASRAPVGKFRDVTPSTAIVNTSIDR